MTKKKFKVPVIILSVIVILAVAVVVAFKTGLLMQLGILKYSDSEPITTLKTKVVSISGDTATVEVLQNYDKIEGTDKFSNIKKGQQIKFVKPDHEPTINETSGEHYPELKKVSELKNGDKVDVIITDLKEDYTVEDNYASMSE